MKEHWDRVFRENPGRYGTQRSTAAALAMERFANLRLSAAVLDLGTGAGRDAIFFAGRGLRVVALDFSAEALLALTGAAALAGLQENIETVQSSVGDGLPFAGGTFDACYAHMLFCMDFTRAQLAALFAETHRILKPGGLLTYTVRTTNDPDFGTGVHHGENLFEDEGFTVHFFDRQMVEEFSTGFKILDIRLFEEGALPRRLFFVALERT